MLCVYIYISAQTESKCRMIRWRVTALRCMQKLTNQATTPSKFLLLRESTCTEVVLGGDPLTCKSSAGAASSPARAQVKKKNTQSAPSEHLVSD